MSLDPKNTKILYLTDSYARKVAGVKISLLTEMRARGFKVVEQNVHTAGVNKIDGTKLLRDLRKGSYTQVWVAHTWVEYVGCTLADINKLNIKVLGFGFSDPYEWNPDRLKQYNYYATHSLRLANRIKVIPTVPFTTSCDLGFHTDLQLPKTTDVLFDLEEPTSPLAHRNFEFPACGTPIITRRRHDVTQAFKGKDVPVYDNLNQILTWVGRMLKDPVYYKQYRDSMYKDVRKHHSIKNRVNVLLNWLDKR